MGWAKADAYGIELVDVRLERHRLSGRGVGIAVRPVLFHLEYELDTGPDFVTSRLAATTRGSGWRRSLELVRGRDARWRATYETNGVAPFEPPTAELKSFSGALDCDLQMSPLTNSMPVLRDGLLAGGSAHDYVMAWVALPSLTVTSSRQRYVPLGSLPDGGRTIRYESLDSDFSAEVTFDSAGLVIDYPQLGRRVG